MKNFVFDVIIDEDNICNLVADGNALWKSVLQGDHVVFSGRRNTGKTSLIKNVVLKKYRKRNKKGLILFCDMMGVRSLDQISMQLKTAFERGISDISSLQSAIRMFVSTMKNMRPMITADPLTGMPSIMLDVFFKNSSEIIEPLFAEIGKYHKKHGAIIVIDEFQDVSTVKEAPALLRNCLQNLPARFPVILMGSKKHLLANMFASPDAPFFSWGRHVEISNIKAEEYCDYINERFKPVKLSITVDAVKHLLELVQNIPECVNIVCEHLVRTARPGVVSKDNISTALRHVIEERSPVFREKLSVLSEKEALVLKVIAQDGPIKKPNNRDFLSKIKMSTGASVPLIARLENDAVIYRLDEGYVVGDPLMHWFLKK